MAFSAQQISSLREVCEILDRDIDHIHDAELGFFRKFITNHFGGRIPVPKAKTPSKPEAKHHGDPLSQDPEHWHPVNETYEEIPVAAEPVDEDRAREIKAEGAELLSNGDGVQAVRKFSEVLRLDSTKPAYWALRAQAYLLLRFPNSAIKDATTALKQNPENARALRARGTAYRHLSRWEESAADLNAANLVDYNPDFDALLKLVQEKAIAIKHQRRLDEIHREEEEQAERLRKQEEYRRMREQEQRAEEEARQQAHSGGMPGGFPGGFPGAGGMPGGFPGAGGMPGGFPGAGGMPGGFPGAGGMPGGIPPGMEALFQDPDIVEALQDPEVAPKLAQVMSNPAMIMQYMADPKLGPLIQKIMSKLGGGMGGMPGGMPGGARGGMPGGFPGGFPGGAPPPRSQPNPPPRSQRDDLD